MNKGAVKVELTKYEMELACQVAMRRQIDAEFGGRKDRVNRKTFSEGLGAHVLGCIGELATAKHFGIYWSGSVNTFHRLADLAGGCEVRHRSKDDWDLIVRQADGDDSLFILSTGDSNIVTIHGGIRGRDAKVRDWSRTYGGKSAAYFVPSEALTGPSDLWNRVRD